MPKGCLALADGHVFVGELSHEQESLAGELVFSTAMTGYTEILSDPSFYNQIVVLTNAEIGNYGVSREDFQSNRIQVKALVVRNFTDKSFSWREEFSLLDWLKEHNVPLLKGIDTRALVSHVREKGVMMAAIGSEKIPAQDLFELAKNVPSMAGQRLSPFVSVSKTEEFIESPKSSKVSYRIVVMDFGVKREILRYLAQHAEVFVVPQNTSADELLSLEPDGICVSNGPGDPHTEVEAINTLKKLVGKVPVFGICLGHQILAQVLGFNTYKLKCGHRGSNHPVLTSDGRVIITAQNHGFAVNKNNNQEECEHNLTDETNEGLYVPELKLLSVQYHPEGAPGPKDATFYFQKFFDMISESKKLRGQLGINP